MEHVKFKATNSGMDYNTVGKVFEGSFVTEHGTLSRDDIVSMAETWINSKDDQVIIDDIIDEALLEIDSNILDEEMEIEAAIDDDEPDVEMICVEETMVTYTHVQANEALDLLQSYLLSSATAGSSNNCMADLNSLRRNILRMRSGTKKTSPTIHSFFDKK